MWRNSAGICSYCEQIINREYFESVPAHFRLQERNFELWTWTWPWRKPMLCCWPRDGPPCTLNNHICVPLYISALLLWCFHEFPLQHQVLFYLQHILFVHINTPPWIRVDSYFHVPQTTLFSWASNATLSWGIPWKALAVVNYEYLATT